MVKEPKKILIIRTDRLGDLILSTPVIRNLRTHFAATQLSFMCRPYTTQVLEGNPYLDEVIVYDKYGRHKGVWANIKFSFYLRKKKFDWAIILHPTNRVNLLTFLAGIPFRVGWDKKMGWLLSKRIPHIKYKGEKHELEYTLDILRSLDIPTDDKNTYFPIKDSATGKVKELLKSHGIGPEDSFIAIHPSASCPSKRWPQVRFSKLVKILKERTSYPVVLVTSKSEREFGQRIIDENDVVDLRGKLNISELGALLKLAKLFVSNDSGPVHIAASLNTPVISIFGRKNPGLSPSRWKPLSSNSIYFHEDAGCRYCQAHNCQKDFRCLKAIKPYDVAEVAFSLLGF